MASNANIETRQGARRLTSVVCQALLDAATPELFRHNAFRITGLPVDAASRVITREAGRLKMMEELGQGKIAHNAAFSLEPPPSVDQIRDAIQRLKDPEQRIIDEFFWFWPERFGESGSDAALRALEGGDSDTALKIWAAKETNPADGLVAMHNLAIFWQLAAIDWEDNARSAELNEQQRTEGERYWRNAFKRWEHLADDDLLWEQVVIRIKQLDDPRLTTGFIRRMRATLPEALDKINAQLAVRYAEDGMIELAQLHVRFMRETNQGLDDVNRTAEMVLAPVSARLKQQIQHTRERAAKNPAETRAVVRELVQQAQRTIILFDLFFGRDGELRNDLSDEVAMLCNQLSVACHKATRDESLCIDILKAALPFATSIELRKQIERNLGTLSGNVAYKKSEPVYLLLEMIQNSKLHPRSLLDRFRREVVPAFANITTDVPPPLELSDAAAIVLRGISLNAWNQHQDRETAVAANELAAGYACGPQVRRQLLEDKAALASLTARQTAQHGAWNIKNVGVLVVLAAFGVLLAINWYDSSKSSSSRDSYVPRSGPTPSRSSSPTANDAAEQDSYLVPSHVNSELKRDLQAIEVGKARVDALNRQIESLGREIDRERLLLDRSSQWAVDAFNRRVNRYNALLEQARSQDRFVNILVQQYNAKLQRYGR